MSNICVTESMSVVLFYKKRDCSKTVGAVFLEKNMVNMVGFQLTRKQTHLPLRGAVSC